MPYKWYFLGPTVPLNIPALYILISPLTIYKPPLSYNQPSYLGFNFQGRMAYFSFDASAFFFFFLGFVIHPILNRAVAWGPVDPTNGFISLPLNLSYYHIQKPYDVPEDQRYSFVNGVHTCWVYSTDKPHTLTSQTKPRTEIAIQVRLAVGNIKHYLHTTHKYNFKSGKIINGDSHFFNSFLGK
jgi:hypothetical protein